MEMTLTRAPLTTDNQQLPSVGEKHARSPRAKSSVERDEAAEPVARIHVVLLPAARKEDAPSSRADFEQLVRSDAGAVQLARLIRSRALSPANMLFASRILGAHAKPLVAVAALLSTIRDEEPLHREGAIDGLFEYADVPEVRSALERVVAHDPIEALREAARTALEQ